MVEALFHISRKLEAFIKNYGEKSLSCTITHKVIYTVYKLYRIVGMDRYEFIEAYSFL